MTTDSEIARLQERADEFVRRIHNLEETLYGNGHAGMKETLALVASDVKKLVDAEDKKVDLGWQWKLLIAGAFLGPIASVIIERITR